MSRFRRKPALREVDPAGIARRSAEAAAGVIQTVYGHTVTYELDDLVFVDQALSDVAASGDQESKAQTIQAFGCLLGEILVRQDGGRWIAFDAENASVFGVAVGVELPNGRQTNPIGAAFRRVTGGAERSVLRFRDGVLGPLDGDNVRERN
ncbi:hypothetical protein [Leifsonia sp. NPDC058248]|uniref:hypothetical protein n=1 Tax=Leifsonia sp. NPDC058248 TaxID=3346402 RepID=UPI0036D79DD3